MLLTRWKPLDQVWDELKRFNEEFSRALERPEFSNDAGGKSPSTAPLLRVWDDGETVHAEAELPGVELADIEVYVTRGNQLTIKGERKLPTIEKANWRRNERLFGTFARTLTLPVSVDESQITATYTNGILTIKLPKAEAAKPRKITVSAE